MRDLEAQRQRGRASLLRGEGTRPREGAARPRPRARRPAAPRPRLPQREPARGVPRPRPGGGGQRHVRPLLPGHDGEPRPEGRGLRPGPERARRGRAHLPPRRGREGAERRARTRPRSGASSSSRSSRRSSSRTPTSRRRSTSCAWSSAPAGWRPVPGANALTINDTPDKVAAAERIVDDRGQAPRGGRGRGPDPRGLAQQAQGVRDLPDLGPRRPGHRGHRLRRLPRPDHHEPRARVPTTGTTSW